MADSQPSQITCAHEHCSYAALGTVSTADGHLALDLWPSPTEADPAAEADPDMLCRHHLIDVAERHMRVSSGHQPA